MERAKGISEPRGNIVPSNSGAINSTGKMSVASFVTCWIAMGGAGWTAHWHIFVEPFDDPPQDIFPG